LDEVVLEGGKPSARSTRADHAARFASLRSAPVLADLGFAEREVGFADLRMPWRRSRNARFALSVHQEDDDWPAE
jgi:hypothetical protein